MDVGWLFFTFHSQRLNTLAAAELFEAAIVVAGGRVVIGARRTVVLGVQHAELAPEGTQHDFGRVAFLAFLIHPFAGFELTLDINFRAFF